MQTAQPISSPPYNDMPIRPAAGELSATTSGALSQYQIIRRNGAVVPFEPNKIAVAMMKAFLAVHGTQGAASASVRETVETLTKVVIKALVRSRPAGGTFHIEDVQDQVELGLMREGHHEIARAYVLYREKRTQERAQKVAPQTPAAPQLHAIDKGQRVVLDLARLHGIISDACRGLSADVKPEPIMAETLRNLYDGVPMDEVYKASVLAARTLIEKDPDYTYATARLLLHTIRREVLGEEVSMLDAFKSADNVLKNAVGGIAEIINVPGLVNVDFEDVRTVMGEMGKAMMGSAGAAGVDRARLAAESAVASPLLEGIELSGARGVLVNITASGSLGLK
jgi:ribonucleoside-diphosphate reductase alpha chain